MDERSDMERAADEVILPGFRFHPTDEELVGFYLKRKIQQKPLSIELIRQLDIYKYDPWDLPKLATTGEKECYFYCPRDRKYRNSARPNRVTGAGFWKATGTDRPIYSSEGTKCIGLKKSLVFYRGRAAKGVKTDWMMHEFRLPSLADSSLPKRPLDKNMPLNDLWAICRIFKKTNSMAQRALSQSWISPLPDSDSRDLFSGSQTINSAQFGSENKSCTSEAWSSTQFGCNNVLQQQDNAVAYPTFDMSTFYDKPINPITFKSYPIPLPGSDMPASFICAPIEMPPATTLPNASARIDFGQSQQYCNGFKVDKEENKSSIIGDTRSFGFPFNMPSNISEEWKPILAWDSSACPSDMTTSFSANKCDT